MMILFQIDDVLADPPGQDVNLAGYIYYPNGSAVGANIEAFAYSSSGTLLGGDNTSSSGFYLIVVLAASATSGDNITVNSSPTGYYGYTVFYNIQGGDNGLHSINLTDTVAPSVVSGFTATAISAGGALNLSWTANSDDTVGYKLYRGATLIATKTPASNNSYLDSGLTNGQSYTYYISAYDSAPNYAANASASGTPQDTLAPAQVTGVVATGSNHTIVLTWSAVTQNSDSTSISDLSGYHVYMNVSGTFTLVNTTTGTTYTNSALTNLVAYQFKVAAYDDDGNEGANSTVTSGTPSERPSISATPSTGATIKSSVQINISISSGQNLDVAYYRVYNSTGQQVSAGQTNTSIGATSWSYAITPTSWDEAVAHLVYVYANDTNSQSNQQNYTYTIDDTAPILSGAAASGSLVKSTTAIQLNVTVSDASTITSVTAANVSSVAMTSAGSGLYTLTTNATALGCVESDDVCGIDFFATDAAGNIGTGHLWITVDDVAPAVSAAAISDADAKVKGTDNFQINITVTDTNTISTVTVGNNSAVSMSVLSGSTYSVTTNATAMGCSQGTCTLRFTATDELGNVNNSVTTTLTVDSTAPSINSVTLSDDYVQNATTVAVTINVSDAHTAVASVTAEGTSLTNQGSNIWNGTITLATGNGVVDVTATDTVGNQAADNSTAYTIDDTAPSINSVSLADDYVQNGTVVLLTVNATDSAIASVTAEGVSLTRSGSLWIGNVTLISGDGVINVTATDNASNTATNNSVTYTIDDTAPSINSVTLSDGYVRTGQVVALAINVTDARISSVTASAGATSITLANTSATVWVGNLTAPSASGVITVSAIDAANNTATDNATGFTVDDTAPTFTITVPAQGGVYSDTAGNITFNFTITEANVSVMNISIDSGVYNYGTTTAGAKTNTFSGLKAGTHTAVFTATDEAGNSATSVTRTFKIVRPLNITEVISALNIALGSSLTSAQVLANTTDISSNESANANTTMNLKLTLNVSGTQVVATILNFAGLSANWERTFSSNINTSSTQGTRASTAAGSSIQNLMLFENATNFLNTSDFAGGATIVFTVGLGDLDVLFIEDDSGEGAYKLTACSSVPTGEITTSNMCYTNTSTNVTLYIPHFSGGALANDTAAPNINITAPLNSSTAANSYFTLSFSAYEANPNTETFCNYTLANSSTTTHADYDIDIAEMTQTGTKYDFSAQLSRVSNGNYTLTVSCIDAKNQSSSKVYDLEVVDSTVPSVTAISSSSSGTTTVTVTLLATTNEYATCRYSTSNVVYASMSAMTTTGAQNHSKTLTYTSDSSGTYYVRCSDTAGNVMTTSNSTTYTADVRTSSTGGNTGTTTPVQTVTVYSNAWASIAAGQSQTVTIDTAIYSDVPFTAVKFVALKNLNSPQLKVEPLTSAPSATGATPYKAYKYVQVTETNIGEGDLSSTKIAFKVEKSWLSTNAVDKANIALFRYVNNAWVAQVTSIKSEDSGYVYYEAQTSGFSYFAIGQKEEVSAVTPPVTPPVAPPATTPSVTPSKPSADESEEVLLLKNVERKLTSAEAIWGLIALLVAIILMVVFWKEGKFQNMLEGLRKHEVHKPHENIGKLETYVQAQKDAGRTKAEIKDALYRVGWDRQTINEVLEKHFRK